MSRVARNYKTLDKINDKELIEQIDKEHQEELKKIDYVIENDKVKQNKNYAIYIIDDNKDIIQINRIIDKQIKDMYLTNMETFNNGLDKYKNLDNFEVIYKTDLDIFRKKDNLHKGNLDSIDALNYVVYQFNSFYDSMYLNGFNIRVKDLLDNDIKKEYVKQLASAYTSVQVSDITKLDVNEWLYTDLDKIKDFNFSLDKNVLKDIQENIKKFISDIEDSNKASEIINQLDKQIYDANLTRFTNEVDTYISADIEYYTKVHKLYQDIDKKLIDIVKRFKDKLDSLNNEIIISKTKTKLPSTIVRDIDIDQLFNNIYPNFKYKSIYDDRHKDYDIKAQLMLDLDRDKLDNIEDIRLLDFIKNGNLQLFPIQELLISGFISIRDEQGTDKPIPLLSNLKYINEDNKMRLPSNKKDLQMYEDYMLFFNKCKIQVKITNRETKEVIFELLKPMSILQNTPYTKEGKYGYYIGNSVINILKDELSELYDKPKLITHQTSKQYLKSSKPSTPPMINIKAFIQPKIASMINTYKTKKTYQSKINIEKLYDYQAFYNKNPRPTKKDREKTRELLNSYLDDLKKKDLIVSYKPLNKGKDIYGYQIEINKNAKL